ncbi:hypothetical protein C1645_834710 [Glomus cerebriforme]|uniref:Uncharacterized protein n=1 Tax=Glomus cerebriforme TaxID=658196 RepID=A0A397SA49_9GLOM|nr:hypothetical protein C1645_834710 [Glomus cerebriforme]
MTHMRFGMYYRKDQPITAGCAHFFWWRPIVFDIPVLAKMARRCIKVTLARDTNNRGTDNRRSFSKEQIEALLPDKRKKNLTIEGKAEYCTKASDFIDIITNHWAVGLKNKDENEIIVSVSRQSTFRVKLAEGDVDSAIIEEFAKDKNLIQDSNKIQKERTKKRMANLDRIPIHFSLANVSKRIQNIDISKISTRENLADVIVMLSMRPAEKNPECARELLIWIQDAIKAKKLFDPVFTESKICNAWLFNEFLKQESYKTIPKKLRDYGSKHASRIYSGDTESEDSGPKNDCNPEPELESAENDEISEIINMYSY